MSKVWQLVIGIRNFSYQMAAKEYGLDQADSEYKIKFFGFTSGYVLAFFLIVYIISLNFHDGSTMLEIKKYPLLIKLLISMAIVYLPMKLVNYLLLKKVEHISIPKELDKEKYNKQRILYWSVFLVGHLLWVSVWILGISIRN